MKISTLKRQLKILIKEEVDKYVRDKQTKDLEENTKARMIDELIYIAANYNHGIYPRRVDSVHTIEEVKDEFKERLTEWGKKNKVYKKEIFESNFDRWNPRYKVYMHELLGLFEEDGLSDGSLVRLNEVPSEDEHPALPEDYHDKEQAKKDKEWEQRQQKIPGEK